jgi:hypothetical protein
MEEMEQDGFIQSIRIIHALARIVTEIESMEEDEDTIIRAVSVIEDAHLKSGEPAAYVILLNGLDDDMYISLSVSIKKKEEREDYSPPFSDS